MLFHFICVYLFIYLFVCLFVCLRLLICCADKMAMLIYIASDHKPLHFLIVSIACSVTFLAVVFRICSVTLLQGHSAIATSVFARIIVWKPLSQDELLNHSEGQIQSATSGAG